VGRGCGRFHPIFDRSGRPISTLYAADSLAGAAMETLFRMSVMNAVPRYVPRRYVNLHAYAMLAPRHDLVLVPLWGNNLRRLGLVRARLLEPAPEHYAGTARWAEALHRGSRWADGITWYSRQFDGAVCVMLFGDRVKSRDLATEHKTVSFTDEAALLMLLDIAQQAGITITEA
jgi:hypothetical protein